MFLWLLCLSIVTWFLYFKFSRRNMYKLASKLPVVDGSLPLIGMAHSLSGSTEDILSNLQKYSYQTMKHNGVLSGWLGHILFIFVQNPVDLEMILKTCMEKDDLHRFARSIIGNGVIFAPVSIWRKRRKIMVPAFSPKIVDSFVVVFSEQSAKLASRLNECVDQGNVKMWPYLSTFTFDSVCQTVMGLKMNTQDNPEAPFLKAMQFLLNIVTKRVFHLWLPPEWLFKLFPEYSKYQKHINMAFDFTDEVIAKKRDEIRKEKHEGQDNDFDLNKYKMQSFLDHLIRLSGGENGYNNEELREEVLTLMVAGTDTSAVAIGYTLKLLAMYPQVQEKVFQKLQEIFDDSDRLLVKEDLTKMKLLERVVKESLRLFPPVPFIVRKCLQDIALPSGRMLPAGSGIVCNIWGTHRDPKYWGEDSECFNPDRFLPERYKPQHSCCFFPFSNGPRNCLGYQYALMSIKSALSAIVRQYKIVGVEASGPVPRIKSKLDIMMKAIDDYEVALERRIPVCCTKQI